MGWFDRTPKCAICGRKLEVKHQSNDAVVWDGIECRSCSWVVCLDCAVETADQRKGRCGSCRGETKGASRGL